MSDSRKRLRAELFKCAAKGEFPTYHDMLSHLQPRIDSGWRPEWSDDLNQIAMEERSMVIRHHVYSASQGLLSESDRF